MNGWDKLPLAPVIVSVEVPVGVFRLGLVDTVSVDEPEPVTVAGLKLDRVICAPIITKKTGTKMSAIDFTRDSK